MNLEGGFNKVTTTITDSEEYGNVLHEICHVPHVASLEEFYKMYELEEKAIDEKYDGQNKNTPSIELFAEVFRKFEEYPPNLQKPKKLPATRERPNSNISKSSPSLNDSTGFNTINHNIEKSLSSLNLNKFDNVPSASKTLSDFTKFQKQLKQLKAAILQKDVENEYTSKLIQLSIFAQQLEKLLPTEKVGKSALSPEEEIVLEDLVNKMDNLNFIRSPHNMLGQRNGSSNNISPKLDSLANILSYCISAVNSFNIN